MPYEIQMLQESMDEWETVDTWQEAVSWVGEFTEYPERTPQFLVLDLETGRDVTFDAIYDFAGRLADDVADALRYNDVLPHQDCRWLARAIDIHLGREP